MGTGQFCTNPGMVLLIAGDSAETLIQALAQRFDAAPVGTLLSSSVEQTLQASFRVPCHTSRPFDVVDSSVGGDRGSDLKSHFSVLWGLTAESVSIFGSCSGVSSQPARAPKEPRPVASSEGDLGSVSGDKSHRTRPPVARAVPAGRVSAGGSWPAASSHLATSTRVL